MLVYKSHKFIEGKAKYEKRSLNFGECSGCTDFFADDAVWLFCRIPRELCAFGARVELYRKEDMSTRSIRARCFDNSDVRYGAFALHLMLSDICVPGLGGEILYAFIFETPYGVLYASGDGSFQSDRERVTFQRLKVSPTRQTVVNIDKTERV